MSLLWDSLTLEHQLRVGGLECWAGVFGVHHNLPYSPRWMPALLHLFLLSGPDTSTLHPPP